MGYFDFFWMVYWMTLYAMMVAWVGLMAYLAICILRKPRAVPKESAPNSNEGVTPVASILFAQKSGEEPERTVTFIVSNSLPMGMDMPREMFAGYDTPIAVSAALREDIRRLLELLETKS